MKKIKCLTEEDFRNELRRLILGTLAFLVIIFIACVFVRESFVVFSNDIDLVCNGPANFLNTAHNDCGLDLWFVCSITTLFGAIIFVYGFYVLIKTWTNED